MTPTLDFDDVLMWKRRNKCEHDFREFCFNYFPQYFYSLPSEMHTEMFTVLQETIDNSTADNVALAAPRGNAKSTLISFALPIWCAVYKKKHYIIIVSDTSGQADDFLNNIKNELEDNEYILHDFGDLSGEIWTNSDIILHNDVRIQGLGAGKKIRGRRYKQWRPDLIIADDLENDENVQSSDQRKKMEDWHNKALAKAGDERTDRIVVGTILHYDSLLAKLLKNPVYFSRKYRAVINFSTSLLWDEWEKIIVNLENEARLKDAAAFFESHKEEMLAGTHVLWPTKEPYYNLMIQRIADGPAAFSSEKQNEPLSDDERRFQPDWIQYYDDSDIIGKDLYTVGWVDPSMGKAGGDYSAIITLGMDSNDQVYVLSADIQKRHPDVIADDAISHYLKYHHKELGIESNQFQEFFKDTVRAKAAEKGLQIPIKGVAQHSDKTLRIQSLQPDVKNGRVKFRRDQQMLIEQLVNFPSADHDDGPDALEGAMKLLGRHDAVAEYYKELAHEASKQSQESYIKNPLLERLRGNSS